MKHTLRVFALLTALLLALPMIGCLVKKDAAEKTDPAPTGEVAAPDGLHPEGAAPETDEPVPNPAEFDADAIAIELGDIQITAGEVQDAFDQYVSMFAYGYGLDEETIGQFMGMTEESLVEFYMPQWKANELGITLSDEDEAEIAVQADEMTEEERNEILILFAEAYIDDLDAEIEDASELTDNQLVVALDAIHEELAGMFGEGYTFDDYLAMRRASNADELRMDRYSELLQEQFNASVLADAGEIDAQYEAALAAQKERFDEDPAFYLACQNSGDVEDDFSVCLYVPAESARLQVICVRPEEPDDRYAETADKMQALEAEYGALALNGENEERRAEIETEYAGLKEQLEAMQTELRRAARTRIDTAFAELSGGKSFEDVMNAYNEPDENGSARSDLVILTNDDPDWSALSEAVAALAPGAYAGPIGIDGDYYIVRLVERIPAGVIDRASVEESFREMLLRNATTSEAWQEQLDAWYTEATEAAVFHRETYEMITDVYLSNYDD